MIWRATQKNDKFYRFLSASVDCIWWNFTKYSFRSHAWGTAERQRKQRNYPIKGFKINFELNIYHIFTIYIPYFKLSWLCIDIWSYSSHKGNFRRLQEVSWYQKSKLMQNHQTNEHYLMYNLYKINLACLVGSICHLLFSCCPNVVWQEMMSISWKCQSWAEIDYW